MKPEQPAKVVNHPSAVPEVRIPNRYYGKTYRVEEPMTEQAEPPCRWCVIEGRCIQGEVVWWDSNGRHATPCNCWCHQQRFQ